MIATTKEVYKRIECIVFYVIILLLTIVAICGFISGSTAMILVRAFGENSIFQSKLAFTQRNPPPNSPLPLISTLPTLQPSTLNNSTTPGSNALQGNPAENTTSLYNASKPNAYSTDIGSEGKDVLDIEPKAKTGAKKKHGHIYSFINGDDEQVTEVYKLELPAPAKINNQQDFLFLTTMMVDIAQSEWGPMSLRDYIIFYPFTMEIAAIIWGTVLIIFRAGSNMVWGISKPWIIVVPSIFFFALMAIFTFAYLIIADKVVNDFCTALRGEITDKRIQCGVLIHALQPTHQHLLFDYTFHIWAFSNAYRVALSSWIISLVAMVLRCIFVVDFHLIYVKVTPPMQQEGSELDTETIAISYNEDNKKYQVQSKEREPEDHEEFHSAHSELTTYTSNEDEHPSLKPLIRRDDQQQTHV